jgi:hypothetical protein
MKKNVADPFEWIPLEVLSHCLSFLALGDLFAAGLVSKKFNKASSDCLLWKAICERDLKLTQKWETITWRDYYRIGKNSFYLLNLSLLVTCIAWDTDNCVPNEFKFSDQQKTLSKITSYGVATARSKCLFSNAGKRYVFDIKVNYRRPNFFYGIGFIDKEINFNFVKASYPKSENSGDTFDKRFDMQWFYWSDGNCWDILGSHPVSAKSRSYVAKRGIDRTGTADATGAPSLAFYSGDILGVVVDYVTYEQPTLTFLLNNQVAHQFSIPKELELYLAVYFYNANDSVTIQHCAQDKYDKQLKALITQA